jgi:hypothetical protein
MALPHKSASRLAQLQWRGEGMTATYEIIESIAHITLEDGREFQVIIPEGTDWDEAATRAAVEAYLAANPSE